jgi:hypothetical protein
VYTFFATRQLLAKGSKSVFCRQANTNMRALLTMGFSLRTFTESWRVAKNVKPVTVTPTFGENSC